MHVKSPCIYCGCGCMLNYVVANGKVVRVLPVENDPASLGKPCVKGLSIHEVVNAKDRIKKPLKREGGKLVEISWEEALNIIAEKIKETDPEKIAFYVSSSTTNEVQFLVQKFARRLGCDNIDSSAILCHGATVQAMRIAFGISGMSARMDDVLECDYLLAFGTDPYAAYPVLFNRIVEAKSKGAKLICIEDAFNNTLRFADRVFRIKPATHMHFALALSKAIGTGDEVFANYLQSLDEGELCRACGVEWEEIKELAREIKGKKVAVLFGMSVTQSGFGTENVLALANLAIQLDAYFIPMRGKINVQGAGDMLCRPLRDGMPASAFFYSPEIDFYFIMDSDPVKSAPDSSRVRENLKRAFTVFMGPFMNETAKIADLILPGTLLIEENGTVTTAERRIRRVSRVIDPPSGRSNFEIIKEIARKTGVYLEEENEEAAWESIKKEIATHHNAEIEGFASKHVKWKRLTPLMPRKPKFKGFVLTTRRYIYQFTTGEVSMRSETLKRMAPKPVVLMNPRDMEEMGIKEKVRIKNSMGELVAEVKPEPLVSRGFLVAPFHYSSLPVNTITPLSIDPISFEPNLKYVEVEVESA